MFIKYEPFALHRRIIDVAGEKLALPPLTLLAWASFTHQNALHCPKDSVRFPVAIDTGCSLNLLLREDTAVAWVGLSIHRSTSPPEAWEGMVTDAMRQPLLREPPVEAEDSSGRVVASRHSPAACGCTQTS